MANASRDCPIGYRIFFGYGESVALQFSEIQQAELRPLTACWLCLQCAQFAACFVGEGTTGLLCTG